METYLTIEELADYLKIAENVIIRDNIHSRTWRPKLTLDKNIRRNLLWVGKQDEQERPDGLQSANRLIPLSLLIDWFCGYDNQS